MADRKLRAVVLGAGFIGSRMNEEAGNEDHYTHAAAFSNCPELELSGIADIDPSRAEMAGQFWSIPSFIDVDTVLRETDPEIVGVALATENRLPAVQRLAAHGSLKGILMEKPLGADSEQASQTIQCLQNLDVPVAVNLIRRFCPGHQKVKEIIAAESLGRIQAVTGFYTKGLRHNGIHMVDLLLWFFGQPIQIGKLHGLASSDSQYGMQESFSLAFPDAPRVTVFQCDSAGHSILELDIVGTEGRIRLTDNGNTIRMQSAEPSSRYPGHRLLGAETILQDRMQHTTAHAAGELASAVLRGTSITCGLPEIIAAEKTVDQIVAALAMN